MKNSADRGGCLSCTKAQMHINSRIWKRSKSYTEIPASTATGVLGMGRTWEKFSSLPAKKPQKFETATGKENF